VRLIVNKDYFISYFRKDINKMILNSSTELLSKDPLLHVDMLECIRRDSAEILFASDEAVLLLDIPSQIYMITAENSTVFLLRLGTASEITRGTASYTASRKTLRIKVTIILMNMSSMKGSWKHCSQTYKNQNNRDN
jgi:hypothetical protein